MLLNIFWHCFLSYKNLSNSTKHDKTFRLINIFMTYMHSYAYTLWPFYCMQVCYIFIFTYFNKIMVSLNKAVHNCF